MAEERQAFGGSGKQEVKNTKGLKISNDNSKIAKIAEQKASFEGQADEFMAKKNERNKRVIELVTQFVGFVKDKTITVNKTPIAKDVEKEICSKLVQLCLEIDGDESELIGMGSAAMVNLLLKTTLVQRDIVNDLSYQVSKLEKQLSSVGKETK